MNEEKPTALERVEETGNLTAMQRDPSKVIRSERFSELQEMYHDTFECAELAALANRLYGELEHVYGISVPAQLVVDTNHQGEQVIAAAVDRIDGVTLDEAEPSPELAEKVEELYASVAHYLYEKSTGDDYYLTDLNNPSQYMYGRSSEEQEPRIHLVDTDVFLNKDRENMYLVVEWLARMMTGVERQYGTQFQTARQYIQQFVDESLPEDVPNSKTEDVRQTLTNIRSYLNGDKHVPAPERGMSEFNGA